MADKYRDLIIPLLQENGPLGVNALSKALNAPLSSLQQYLHRQSYFKINEDRKWDLPENVESVVKNTSLQLMTSVVDTNIKLLKSQLEETLLTLSNVTTPLDTLKRGIGNITTPVANKVNIHPVLVKLDTNIKNTYIVFAKYISKVPEEYKELLKNVDLYKLSTEMGTRVVNGEFNADITSLFLERSTELSEDTIELLKEYQKGQASDNGQADK